MLILGLTSLYGQDKYNYTRINKLTEVEGTAYVIGSMENRGKGADVKNRYLLFIDTKSGASHQVDFPNDGHIGKIEQIKIDSLGINKILMSARTLDVDGKNGIDLQDPTQIIIFSADGKEKSQLTDSRLFVQSWVVNKKTGTIVITGIFDTNNNGKYDKTDKSEIAIYDLRTLQLVNKL